MLALENDHLEIAHELISNKNIDVNIKNILN